MFHIETITDPSGVITLECREFSVLIEFCYRADNDTYHLDVRQPYRPAAIQTLQRSDYERDEVFYNRALSKAYSIIAQLMEECACIASNEQRLQAVLEEIRRDHISRMEQIIEHFDFDPLDERQLDNVARVAHKLGKLCEELSDAS